MPKILIGGVLIKKIMAKIENKNQKDNLDILFCLKNIDNGIVNFLNTVKKLSEININIISYERPLFFKHKISLLKNFKSRKYTSLPESFHLKKLFIFIDNLVFTLKFLIKNKPKIVVAIGVYCLILLCLCKKIFTLKNKKSFTLVFFVGANIIQTINMKPSFIYRKFLKFLVGWGLKNIDYLISPSLYHLVLIKKYYKVQVKNKIIPHGISLKQKYKKNYKTHKNKTIITVGRLHYQKDFETIIRAFKIYLTEIRNQKNILVIIGDGPLKLKLKKIVSELKININVKFTGWVNNVFPYLKKADIFVFSSNYEGFGYVILEAMSCGLPIISTDTPFGPREILDNGKYGILVPMKDPKAMAEAIYQLLTDEKKYQYYSKKSLERVKNFSEEKMLKRYKELFLALINNKINFCKSY